MPEPLWFTRDVFLYGEIRRLGRFLMAEEPRQASLYAQKLKPVEAVMRHGNGVVRFERGGEVTGFMVVRNATVYVSHDKPESFSDDEVVACEIPEQPTALLMRRLNRLNRAMRRCLPDAHQALGVGQLVERIEGYYDRPEQERESSEQTIGLIVGDVLRTHAVRTTALIPLIECGSECGNRVIREYNTLGVTGHIAGTAVATLMFFGLHPTRERLHSLVSQEPSGVAGLIRDLGGRGTFTPPMQVGFYLSDPDAFLAARGAARMLRQQGKDYCRAAVSAMSGVVFYEYLYAALIMYLAAQHIYAELLEVGDHVPSIWADLGWDREEHRRYWVETEEARVSVLTSLAQAAMPWMRGPNPTRPSSFFRYVAAFFVRNGFERTELMIQDLTVRLICPEFVRDLALGLLSARSGQSVDRSLSRVKRIISELEQDLPGSVLRGEPNTLHYAYGIGAELERRKGSSAAAALFDEKQIQLPARVNDLLN